MSVFLSLSRDVVPALFIFSPPHLVCLFVCLFFYSRIVAPYLRARWVHSPNLFKEKRSREVVRIGCIIIFHLSKLKSQVLAVWCNNSVAFEEMRTSQASGRRICVQHFGTVPTKRNRETNDAFQKHSSVSRRLLGSYTLLVRLGPDRLLRFTLHWLSGTTVGPSSVARRVFGCSARFRLLGCRSAVLFVYWYCFAVFSG